MLFFTLFLMLQFFFSCTHNTNLKNCVKINDSIPQIREISIFLLFCEYRKNNKISSKQKLLKETQDSFKIAYLNFEKVYVKK